MVYYGILRLYFKWLQDVTRIFMFGDRIEYIFYDLMVDIFTHTDIHNSNHLFL